MLVTTYWIFRRPFEADVCRKVATIADIENHNTTLNKFNSTSNFPSKRSYFHQQLQLAVRLLHDIHTELTANVSNVAVISCRRLEGLKRRCVCVCVDCRAISVGTDWYQFQQTKTLVHSRLPQHISTTRVSRLEDGVERWNIRGVRWISLCHDQTNQTLGVWVECFRVAEAQRTERLYDSTHFRPTFSLHFFCLLCICLL